MATCGKKSPRTEQTCELAAGHIGAHQRDNSGWFNPDDPRYRNPHVVVLACPSCRRMQKRAADPTEPVTEISMRCSCGQRWTAFVTVSVVDELKVGDLPTIEEVLRKAGL